MVNVEEKVKYTIFQDFYTMYASPQFTMGILPDFKFLLYALA